MHGVVTPNMVAASSGFPSLLTSDGKCSMPHRALTALVKIFLEMSFKPSTSTMDGTIIRSLVPTYWETLPDAIVEIIIFGTPIGRARIAGAAMDVPPEPPAEITPSNFPAAYSSGSSFFSPRDSTSVAIARSFFATISLMSAPTAAAISALETSASNAGSKTPVLMQNVPSPRASIRLLINPNSFPFVSSVPITAIVFIHGFLPFPRKGAHASSFQLFFGGMISIASLRIASSEPAFR